MEGVEDIPDTALHEGLAPGNWESPEHLQAFGRRRYDIDIAVLLLTVWVARLCHMSAPYGACEQANAEDYRHHAGADQQGLAAGAVGLSTSRTMAHRSKSGTSPHVPGRERGSC